MILLAIDPGPETSAYVLYDGTLTVSVEEPFRSGETMAGVFTGKVIGTGTGAETGKCEVYGIT